jgi:YesN/AraC family two-component response regulator
MTARILVVDDEPDLETLIQQKFRHQIHGGAVSFLFARDGVEALTVLEANRNVDLVVTDINMPRMDGLSLLQKLQESEEKLSTIIVSAYGDIANIRTAMNRGAFDFLTKPIDFADLETTIAGEVHDFDPLLYMERKEVKRADRFAQFAVATAGQALKDAKLAYKTFGELNADKSNAFGKCVAKATVTAAAAVQNAAKSCKAQQADANFANAASNPSHLTFDAFYGANGKGKSADANALGKCVSKLTQLSTNAQTKADVSAAKSCKAELAASKTNFATAYGAGRNAFGVCVARHSKL